MADREVGFEAAVGPADDRVEQRSDEKGSDRERVGRSVWCQTGIGVA